MTSYAEDAKKGAAHVFADWANRQAYLRSIIKEYGELELQRTGRNPSDFQKEIEAAADTIMEKFLGYTFQFAKMGLEGK